MDKIALTEAERNALKELKALLSQRFTLLDFRLFGSKARGELEDTKIFVNEIRLFLKNSQGV